MASIRRTKSGTWQVRYWDPNEHQHARNFARKTDATRFAAAVETDKSRGDWLDPRLAKITFAEWSDDWLGQIAHLKAKTRLNYENTLRKHVLPAFGQAQVGLVDRATMRRFVSELTARGAGPDTVRVAVQVARSVLEVALDAGAIKANPARGLSVPRAVKAEKLFLTAEQVETLAEAIDPIFATLIRFAAYTGLRAGELAAIRVGRLDMLRGTLEVAESLSDVGGYLEFGPTKTYARRHVPLPPFLRDELAVYLTRRELSGRDDLVFTALRGAPLRHNLFYRKKFKPAVARAGLPQSLRFHD
ncbi:MAG: tyrosine-type recombinase/integrase, partial [Acidimicrobiales bacterium]